MAALNFPRAFDYAMVSPNNWGISDLPGNSLQTMVFHGCTWGGNHCGSPVEHFPETLLFHLTWHNPASESLKYDASKRRTVRDFFNRHDRKNVSPDYHVVGLCTAYIICRGVFQSSQEYAVIRISFCLRTTRWIVICSSSSPGAEVLFPFMPVLHIEGDGGSRKITPFLQIFHL